MTTIPEQAVHSISLTDPRVIIAGIKQFGLAPDGSDLRDLAAAFDHLTAAQPLMRVQRPEDVARALEEWRKTWKAMLDASGAYNARLTLARAERERGNWSMSLDPEYQVMEEAKKAVYPAHEKLFAVLSLPHTRQQEQLFRSKYIGPQEGEPDYEAPEHTGQPQEGADEGTHVTVGLGLCDIGPIKSEGRTGVLVRPRGEHIPFGEPGELQNTEYWPRKGYVVIWVEGDGPGVLIKELAALSASPASPRAEEEK